MTFSPRLTSSIVALSLSLTGAVSAAQLQIEPIVLEMASPAVSGMLTLHNVSDRNVVIQTRVMRWLQNDGKEALEPATEVAASPPLVTLKPNSEYVVRVVRTAKQPIVEPENYRVLVDELPDPTVLTPKTVHLLIRQSIPVFYESREARRANVSWSVAHDGRKLILHGANAGDAHLRIASLQLKDRSGRMINFGNGLAGYVLGRSTLDWTIPNPPKNFGSAGPISVSAQTDKGPLNAIAQ